MRIQRCLAVALLSLFTIPASAASEGFSVGLWVRAEAKPVDFPALVSSKEWKAGELVDFTSNSNLGVSSTSGSEAGWCLALQPNGSWTWNLSDGQGRLDYLPTFTGQPIADGDWHHLAFSIDLGKREARLYRDGRNVAIYSTRDLQDQSFDPERLWLPTTEESTRRGWSVENVRASPSTLTPASVAAEWRSRATGDAAAPADSATQAPPTELRILSWNIWHGGRRDGLEEGLRKTLDVIRRSRADVVAMQETYGSGPILADALGWYFYLRSSNLSVLSRYPILTTHDLYQPFRFGCVTLEPSPGRYVRVASLWIHYLPDYGVDMLRGGVTVEQLLKAEGETRAREIRDILSELRPLTAECERVPLIVAGDFNSPSHLDWTAAVSERHGGLVVDWPVSRQMEEAGFSDAFRLRHPDVEALPGHTWSPRFTDAWQDRIDYVYFRGDALSVREASMLDEHEDGWPSDHAAVLATLNWALPTQAQ